MDKLQGLLLGFLALRSIIASPRTFLRMVVKERRRSKSFRSQLRNGWKIVGPPALVSIILMQANLRLTPRLTVFGDWNPDEKRFRDFMANPGGIFKIVSFELILTMMFLVLALASFYSAKMSRTISRKPVTEWQVLNFEVMTQCAYACWGIAAGAIAMISHLTGQNIRIYGDFYSNWNTAAQSLLNWALYALIIRNNCIYAAAFHMGCWRALWIRWRFFLALYLVVASTFVVVTL